MLMFVYKRHHGNFVNIYCCRKILWWFLLNRLTKSIATMITFHLKIELFLLVIINLQLTSSDQYDILSPGQFRLDQYHSHEEVNHYLKLLSRAYVTRCELFSVGYSFEGRQILGIRIGELSSLGKKNVVWIDAGGDPRTWLNPAAALFMISQLVQKTQDSDINRMVRGVDWYIVPITNPDGYEYTRTQVRSWFHTRSTTTCTLDDCNPGASYNNNWDFHWGGNGASASPYQHDFRGANPFSEPETLAMSIALAKLAEKSTLQAYITLAEYGQKIRYPYGYKRQTYPKNINDLVSVAKVMQDYASRVHGTDYQVQNLAHYWPITGNPIDWVSGVLNVTYSYTISSRPQLGAGFTAFSQPPEVIIPNSEELFEAIKVIFDVSAY